jgi:ABC-type transport system involved in multi-copper enzyme maturation permease subunit
MPPDLATAASTKQSLPSPLRSWFYLVGFSFRQMARLKQMVGIAIGLLLLTCLVTSLITVQFGWDRTEQRAMRNTLTTVQFVGGGMVAPVFENSPALDTIRRENKPLTVFSRWVIFFLFLGFLLPLWSMSFASSALGSDRENRSLIWLMSRPLPRSGIYLAKFLAVLPWCLAMNLGGYLFICLCGGATGRQALPLYWPAILAGSLAFAAVFHLIAALFSRPTIVGLLYAFFFETILSELPVPGTVKRLSINYYTRCLMYSAARAENVPVESDSLFVPVSDRLAWLVLLGATVVITAFGMWFFSRSEQRDD